MGFVVFGGFVVFSSFLVLFLFPGNPPFNNILGLNISGEVDYFDNYFRAFDICFRNLTLDIRYFCWLSYIFNSICSKLGLVVCGFGQNYWSAAHKNLSFAISNYLSLKSDSLGRAKQSWWNRRCLSRAQTMNLQNFEMNRIRFLWFEILFASWSVSFLLYLTSIF